MSSIDEDIYVDVYVPIKDLELAKFDLTKEFAEQGYDIYNINSEFYNDFCSPANLGDNDITLEDRKSDIYPQNITLCKSNCIYKGINIEEQRVICSCNLNSNKNIDENDEFVEDDGNFLTYLLDNINYKIFKCYKLFFNVKNLRNSNAFYIILIIYLILLVINCIFVFYSFERLKLEMTREKFTEKIKNNEMISDSKKICITQNLNINKLSKLSNPNRKIGIIKLNDKSNSKGIKYKTKSNKNVTISVLNDKFLNSAIAAEKSPMIKNNNKTNLGKVSNKKKSDDNLIYIDKTKEKSKEENMNELPYSKAIQLDKRNIFRIFYSIIIGKFDLINIFCYEHQIKSILFSEYVLNLLSNFFFNALLYSDDVVSNKYHNNGKLDLIVTLTLSILSNIITSIFCFYIKYSRGIDERINLVLEIKYRMHYYKNLKKLLLYLKIKFICFFITQLIIIVICLYYIVIFSVLYSCSQKSLIVNFCYSLVESIITSFGVTLIILITRKIGLSCSNKELYNTSKYINSKF